MAEIPPDSPPVIKALDADLYCLTCGYNLRGLYGDPCRCPECGNMNPIEDIQIPARLIAQRFARMETAPALCVLASLIGAYSLLYILLITTMEDKTPDIYRHITRIAAIPALCLLTWLGSLVTFREYCLAKPGWRSVLSLYHGYALLLCMLIIGLIVGGLALGSFLSNIHTALAIVVYGVLGSLIIMVIATLGKRAHRHLHEKMNRLQREVAITTARDEIRRKLKQPPKHGWGYKAGQQVNDSE